MIDENDLTDEQCERINKYLNDDLTHNADEWQHVLFLVGGISILAITAIAIFLN